MAASGEPQKIPFCMGLKEDKKSNSWWVDNSPWFMGSTTWNKIIWLSNLLSSYLISLTTALL